MLENKKLNMVISLLIAIALWAFVIGEVNPEATRAYRDVPIKFLHEESLEQNDMAVYQISDTTLHLTLTGTRSEMNKVDIKDITATVDLRNAVAYGENRLKIDLRVPGKVEIDSQSIEQVSVYIDQLVSKEVDVHVRYQGEFSDEAEPITIEQELKTVSVTGANEIVKKVVAAYAIVEADKVTAEAKTIQCPLVAVSENGKQISGVSLSAENMTITMELAGKKTVPLEVVIVDDENAKASKQLTMPRHITLLGKSADLQDIEVIRTQKIDIRKIKEDTTITIQPILPEGVSVSDDTEPLRLVIKMTKTGTRSISIDTQNIVIEGLQQGYAAEMETGKVEVILTGAQSVIEAVNEEDIRVYANLNGLGEGRYQVDLTTTFHRENVEVDIKPEKTAVVITREQAVSSDMAQQQAPDNSTDYNKE